MHMLPLSSLSLMKCQSINMFSSIMLNRVVSNTNSDFIITKKVSMVSHILDEDSTGLLGAKFSHIFPNS